MSLECEPTSSSAKENLARFVCTRTLLFTFVTMQSLSSYSNLTSISSIVGDTERHVSQSTRDVLYCFKLQLSCCHGFMCGLNFDVSFMTIHRSSLLEHCIREQAVFCCWGYHMPLWAWTWGACVRCPPQKHGFRDCLVDVLCKIITKDKWPDCPLTKGICSFTVF